MMACVMSCGSLLPAQVGPSTNEEQVAIKVFEVKIAAVPKGKTLHAKAGKTVTVRYKASVVNPFGGQSPPCTLGTPTWTWSGPNNLTVDDQQPATEDYTVIVSQSSAQIPIYKVQFKANRDGKWKWQTTAVASAQDSCEGKWTGIGLGWTTLVAIENLAPAEPFTVEAHPNSDLAIPPPVKGEHIYKKQVGTVEVLKGWMVKYTAPKEFQGVTWYYGADKQFGTPDPTNPNSSTSLENTLGVYQIHFKGKDKAEAEYVSPKRTVVVGDPILNAFSVEVQPKNTYVKIEIGVAKTEWVSPPQMGLGLILPAVVMKADVENPKDRPTLEKLRWAFVQEVRSDVKDNTIATWYWDNKVGWLGNSQKGDKITVPEWVEVKAYTPNQAYCDHELRGTHVYGKDLYKFNSGSGDQEDTPFIKATVVHRFPDELAPLGMARFFIKGQQKYQFQYITSVVIHHPDTQQYVPLKQHAWSLKFDSTEKGPWSAKDDGKVEPLKVLPYQGQKGEFSVIPLNNTPVLKGKLTEMVR